MTAGLQFAVVREDPLVEVELVRAFGCRRVLLVASGGCTALTLQAAFPELELTLVDPNPAQLAHVREKVAALRDGFPPARFYVEDDDPTGLGARGNFETLFRSLRDFLRAFAAPAETIRRVIDGDEDPRALTGSRWWPVAFELYFSDAMLETMFGPDATQHAPRGSYPAYFRRIFERGLAAPRDNPFLHHALLGHYLRRAPPAYLAYPVPPAHRFAYVQARIDEVDPAGFDLVHLSNVFDWMAPEAVRGAIDTLRARLDPGAVVTWRQLNNDRDLPELFGGDVIFDGSLGERLRAGDRSLFYTRLHVGRRWTG